MKFCVSKEIMISPLSKYLITDAFYYNFFNVHKGKQNTTFNLLHKKKTEMGREESKPIHIVSLPLQHFYFPTSFSHNH